MSKPPQVTKMDQSAVALHQLYLHNTLTHSLSYEQKTVSQYSISCQYLCERLTHDGPGK